MIRILLLCLAVTVRSRFKLVEIPPDPPPPRDDRITIKGDFCTVLLGSWRSIARSLRRRRFGQHGQRTHLTEKARRDRRVTAVRAAWTEILKIIRLPKSASSLLE